MRCRTPSCRAWRSAFSPSGLNVFAMTLGGLVAGLLIAVLAGAVSRATALQEDASLAVFLLVSLAFGVVIVTVNGIDVEQLMEFLFGETAAKMNVDKLVVIAVNATISVIALALIYRPLALDCVDPGFLRSVSRAGGIAHLTFLALLVLNLISAFHALGTLARHRDHHHSGDDRAVLDARHFGDDRAGDGERAAVRLGRACCLPSTREFRPGPP